MKKALSIFAILAFAFFAMPVDASELALNGVTATATSHWYNVLQGGIARAQVWSASTSSATVLLECSENPLGTPASPAFACQTITNPTSTGAYVTGAATYVRVRVSAYSSGTISAYVGATNGVVDSGH